VEHHTTYKQIKITMFFTRPNRFGSQVMLTKKNLHHFFNGKPVDILLPFKTLFYEIYQRYKVKKHSVLPFVWMHFETEELSGYEVRVLHDTRYIQFTPLDEGMLIRKLQTELAVKFRDMNQKSEKEDAGESDGGAGEGDEAGLEKKPQEEEDILNPKKLLRGDRYKYQAAAQPEDPKLREAKFKDKVQQIKDRIKAKTGGATTSITTAVA
jgi:hypothetical protein